VQLYSVSLWQAGRVAGPLLLASLVLATAARWVQIGCLWLPARLQPRLARIDPRHAGSRLFSWDGLYMLASGAARLLAALVGGAAFAWCQRQRLWELMAVQPAETIPLLAGIFRGWAGQFGLVLLALGIVDYGYRRWQLERELRMSPEQMRAEIKAVEGNTQVSASRRDLARALRRAAQPVAPNERA
jgi:flagellar biosynthetic protein FlhB